VSNALNRFLAKIEEDPETGCWEWQACIQNGYGYFFYEKKWCRAARISYQLFVGDIPEGLELDHVVCQNTFCVNFEHLEAVTHRENTLRGNSFVAANAKKTECPKGHPYSDTNTYVSPRGDRSCKICTRARVLRHYHKNKDKISAERRRRRKEKNRSEQRSFWSTSQKHQWFPYFRRTSITPLPNHSLPVSVYRSPDISPSGKIFTLIPVV